MSVTAKRAAVGDRTEAVVQSAIDDARAAAFIVILALTAVF